jgi:carboxypeptidase T
MRKLIPWAAIVIAAGLVLPIVGTGAGGGQRIVSIARADLAAARLTVRDLDILVEKGGRISIVSSPEALEALSAKGIAWTAEPDPFDVRARQGLSADGGINGAYHSPFELETDFRLLERDHPGLARVVEIGQSLEGRRILALKVTDNASRDEDEPAVLVMGCHHAREWISVEVPFLYAKYLLENYDLDPEVRGLVDASEIWIVPVVNPDGLDYSIHVYRYWRKNRRANPDGTYGVDVNRNYGYRWGYDDDGSSGDPASEVYRGAGPFSEPETAAVRGLFAGRDVRAVVSFHSYGEDILYPWGYTADPAPREAELRAIAAAMSGLIAAAGGPVYSYGQASTALYPTNGDTIDWTYSLAGAPSFTIELSPVDIDQGGFFNDEAAIGAVFAENLPALLYLTRYAVDHPLPVRRRVPARPTRLGDPRTGGDKTALRTPPLRLR